MRCALISETLDLKAYYGETFARLAPQIDPVLHPVSAAPETIEIALAWRPPQGAFARYPNLKAVCSIAAGVDNILACSDLPAHVEVARVVDPEQGALMSAFALWHVLWHLRRFDRYLAQQRQGLWERGVQRAPSDMKVAVLGFGQIGQRVAGDLVALGFPVLAWTRSHRSAPSGVRLFHGTAGLQAMLPETEVVINLLPLTEETRGLLARPFFARMKRGGYLIQLGRGEHLLEDDLLAALADGTLAGASLDVFSVEPLPPGHPFWTHPNIVMTPHDASYARPTETVRTLAETAADIAAGKRPRTAIDRARGY
jgi:glyoxylate/hydroxypyruvate reductase A